MNEPTRKNSKPEPTILVRLRGTGILPESVGVADMAEVVKAIQALAESDLKLMRVKRSSAAYQLVTESVEQVDGALNLSGQALLSPSEFLKSQMLKPFDDLDAVVKRLKCIIEVRSLVSNWKWTIGEGIWEKVRRRSLIRDETIVFGKLIRVGGATEERCAIRVPNRTKLLYCRLRHEGLAKRLGRHLYQDMTLHGEGLFFVKDWSMLNLTVHDFTVSKSISFDAMREKLRDSGGRDWDRYEDPLARLREIRGEQPE